MSLLAYYKKKAIDVVPDLLQQLYPFDRLFSVRKRLTNDLTYPNLRLQRSGDLAEVDITLSVFDDWTSVLPSVVAWLGGSTGFLKGVYCQNTGLLLPSTGPANPVLIDSSGNLTKDEKGNVSIPVGATTTLIIPSSGSLFSEFYDGTGNGATSITLSQCSANGMLLSSRLFNGIDIEYRGTSTMRFLARSSSQNTEFYEPTGFFKDVSHKIFAVFQPQVNISGERTKVWLNGVGMASSTTGVEPPPDDAAANMGVAVAGANNTTRMVGFWGEWIYGSGNKEADRTAIMEILNYQY